jgi:hypothetical protein
MLRVVGRYLLLSSIAIAASGIGVYLAVGADGFLRGMVWPMWFFPVLFAVQFAGDFKRSLRLENLENADGSVDK